MCNRKIIKQQHGFTLLEVLASVLILGLAYVATLESFSIALRNIDKVQKVRSAVFDEMVAFSLDAKFTGLDSGLDDDEEKDEDATLFIEGHKFRLMEVRSESGEAATLQLRPLL